MLIFLAIWIGAHRASSLAHLVWSGIAWAGARLFSGPLRGAPCYAACLARWCATRLIVVAILLTIVPGKVGQNMRRWYASFLLSIPKWAVLILRLASRMIAEVFRCLRVLVNGVNSNPEAQKRGGK